MHFSNAILVQEDRTWSHYSNISENFQFMFSYKSLFRNSNSGFQGKRDAARLGNFHIYDSFLPFQINFLIPFYTSVCFKLINILSFKNRAAKS